MDIPPIPEHHVDALHRLRIGGGAPRDALAAIAGGETVEALVAGGLVSVAGPRLRLSPVGRRAHEAALARELDVTGSRRAVEDAYQRFLPINGDVLTLCTDWQMRMVNGTPVLNDHRDKAHDEGVIRRLEAATAEAGRLLAGLAERLARFAGYRGDLLEATDRVCRGNTDFLTNPRVRCFHTVWFELHEDLLATLGIDRADEADAVGAVGR